MRGKENFARNIRLIGGITPAYAGKSERRIARVEIAEDHPCVCGEKTGSEREKIYEEGSPLRMRGKVTLAGDKPSFTRITPAYAGKRTGSQAC